MTTSLSGNVLGISGQDKKHANFPFTEDERQPKKSNYFEQQIFSSLPS
jgi:hypothetical protein